jgi:hypothetical protein
LLTVLSFFFDLKQRPAVAGQCRLSNHFFEKWGHGKKPSRHH